MAAVRVAVIGHIEWVTHVRGNLPHVGQIAHLEDPIEGPAGGGTVSAVQVARLGADCRFFTALSTDWYGEESREILSALGVKVIAAARDAPQTRAFTVAEPSGERTILVAGDRLSPTMDDDLPWGDLGGCSGVFFTGDDPRTLIAARAAKHVVVTARRLASLAESGVQVDVVVASSHDEAEAFDPRDLPVQPRAYVYTEGPEGGRIVVGDREQRYVAAPVPGLVVDTYGAGDSFAAGLTVGLARGRRLDEAVDLAARCGAHVLTGRGGLEAQLTEG